MPISRYKMFMQLYKKELRDILPEIIIVAVITILFDGWSYFRVDNRPEVILIPIFLTLGMAALLPFFTSFKVLSSEWSNNTVYLIRSLPVSGGIILGAKLLALLTQLLIGILIAGGIGAIMAMNLIPEFRQVLDTYPEIMGSMWQLLLLGILSFLGVCSVSFLAQIIGKLSRKFSGLISFTSFLIIMYVMGKLSDLMGMRTEIVSDNVQSLYNSQGMFGSVLNIHLLGILLIYVLIFVIAAWLFDRKVEL